MKKLSKYPSSRSHLGCRLKCRHLKIRIYNIYTSAQLGPQRPKNMSPLSHSIAPLSHLRKTPGRHGFAKENVSKCGHLTSSQQSLAHKPHKGITRHCCCIYFSKIVELLVTRVSAIFMCIEVFLVWFHGCPVCWSYYSGLNTGLQRAYCSLTFIQSYLFMNLFFNSMSFAPKDQNRHSQITASESLCDLSKVTYLAIMN